MMFKTYCKRRQGPTRFIKYLKMNLPKLGKKGQGGVVGNVITVAVVAIVIFITMLLIVSVRDSIDRSGFSTADNTTFDSVVTNTNTALTLLGISLIVLGAIVIIGIILAIRSS